MRSLSLYDGTFAIPRPYLSGIETLRFIKCWRRLRFGCICVLKTLRFEMLRFRGTQGKRPMQFGGLRAKTQRMQLRFAIQICNLELPPRAGLRIGKLRS